MATWVAYRAAMRLAAITNWAYGATLVLTAVSGTTMLLASNAQDAERAAADQRFQLDQLTSNIESEVFGLSDRARQYLNTGDPTYRILYAREYGALRSADERVAHVRDAGATFDEVEALKRAVVLADTLHDEQASAFDASSHGQEQQARAVIFGAEYERTLDQSRNAIERFQDRLNQRTEGEVRAAAATSRRWKALSEVVLGATGLLFLCVLFFIFKQRVLRPVLRLSDVVVRLAAQDYAAEPPPCNQIDEIGDMAQAISVFRENGLERQRLEQERNTDRELRDLLSRMTQRMQGCDSLADLKNVICRFIPEIAPLHSGRLYLLAKDRNAVVEACSWDGLTHSRHEFAPTDCWALRRGIAHLPSRGAIDVPCGHLIDGDVSGIGTQCFPLTAQHETLGLLYFERREDVENAKETPEIYFSMLAENISLAVSNLLLREALRDMAMVDPLTGLANRRSFEAALPLHSAEASRMEQPISFLMIDVDYFKRFNDEFGHECGDAVLCEVGRVIRGCTRTDDLAFRYGGEEFSVLLPGVGPDQAVTRAEEIRTRISDLRVKHEGRELGPITISAGVASFPAHCAAERLVPLADRALLQAKAHGRNCVEIAQLKESRAAA